MKQDLLTVPQVAEALGVKPSRVWQFIRARRLKVSAIYGRMLITRKEVERFQGIPRKSGRPWPKRKRRKHRKHGQHEEAVLVDSGPPPKEETQERS